MNLSEQIKLTEKLGQKAPQTLEEANKSVTQRSNAGFAKSLLRRLHDSKPVETPVQSRSPTVFG